MWCIHVNIMERVSIEVQCVHKLSYLTCTAYPLWLSWTLLLCFDLAAFLPPVVCGRPRTGPLTRWTTPPWPAPLLHHHWSCQHSTVQTLYSVKYMYVEWLGEIMMHQTRIQTLIPSILSQVLYHLSYLVPVFDLVWQSHSFSLKWSKWIILKDTLRLFPFQELTCQFKG